MPSSPESPSATSTGGLLFPKVFRVKKQKKPLQRRSSLKATGKPLQRKSPLRRSSPLRRTGTRIKRRKPLRGRSGRDPAAFAYVILGTIFAARLECVISGELAFDMSHILGRGESFGIKKNHPDRVLFSSPFNCGPLKRPFHKGGHRDKPAVRWRLLENANDAVMKAVDEGLYEITEIDRRYIAEIREPWKAKNPA